MSAARIKAAAILLFCAALIGACDRWSPEPSPVPASGSSNGDAMRASDAACALPLGHFAPSRLRLAGSALDYPTNLVLIDSTGGLRWNSELVGPRRLGEYIGQQAAVEPPPVLVIQPDRDAPCAMVRETLSSALRIGRCSPERCAFEWPGALAPPPPSSPLPDRTLLLGNWTLVSIDGAGPPPGAPPVEVIFTDGEVGARSQCVSFAWLIGVEEGRLRLRVPNRPVSMCARGLSAWEKAFDAAMPAAARIDSDGRETIVTGPKGRLKLKRPA